MKPPSNRTGPVHVGITRLPVIVGLLLAVFSLAGPAAGQTAAPPATPGPGLRPPQPATPKSEKLTVEQAVAEAVEKNLDLLAERSNIAIAQARILTGRLRPNPELSVTADHLDFLGTGYSLDNGAGPPEYAAGTQFTLEGGGKRRRRVEEAQAALTVTQLEFLDSVRLTVLQVQNAFVDALLAHDNLVLARKNADSQHQIVEINEVRQRTGDIAEVELIRSRLAALQYDNTVRLAEMKFRNTLVELQRLLGRRRPSPGFGVLGEQRRDPAIPHLQDVRKLALERRPDLLVLRSDLKRAETDLQLQIAQGKVDYTVGAEYRRQQGINGTGNSLGFSFGVPLPVFNRNQGEIERARQEYGQVRLRISALEASITSEVESAYRQLLTARDLLGSIEGEMVTQARDVRDITEFSYKRGQATLLELLDAQRAFNETMQSYYDARAEYGRSLYYIDSVTGKAVKP